MAIGFTPKYLDSLSFNELTQSQLLVLAHKTIKKIEWKIEFISESGLIVTTDNGLFSWNAEIEIRLQNSSLSIKSTSTGNEMIDWGRNKKNVTQFVSVIGDLKSDFSIEELDEAFLELKPELALPEEDVLQQSPPTGKEQLTGFFSIFKPKEGYFITSILLNLNLLIFIAMLVSGANIMLPDSDTLLKWGANFRPSTLDGEWWRIITNCFLHIGIIHLLMNMYALIYIGMLLEPILGKSRFLSAYLITGIIASLTSLWWHHLTISAGASGAIFGMFGVFLALLTTTIVDKSIRKSLLNNIAVFVGLNLLLGVKGGIDNAAHIGGLLSGFLIGYIFVPSIKRPESKKLKYGTIGFLSIAAIVSTIVMIKKIPNDIGIYTSKIEEFGPLEDKALKVYSLPKNAPTKTLLNEIDKNGIQIWSKCLKLISSFQQLDLPDQIKKRNELLIDYSKLRIKSYELLYKSIEEDTNAYDAGMEKYNYQIRLKIEEINALQ